MKAEELVALAVALGARPQPAANASNNANANGSSSSSSGAAAVPVELPPLDSGVLEACVAALRDKDKDTDTGTDGAANVRAASVLVLRTLAEIEANRERMVRTPGLLVELMRTMSKRANKARGGDAAGSNVLVVGAMSTLVHLSQTKVGQVALAQLPGCIESVARNAVERIDTNPGTTLDATTVLYILSSSAVEAIVNAPGALDALLTITANAKSGAHASKARFAALVALANVVAIGAPTMAMNWRAFAQVALDAANVHDAALAHQQLCGMKILAGLSRVGRNVQLNLFKMPQLVRTVVSVLSTGLTFDAKEPAMILLSHLSLVREACVPLFRTPSLMDAVLREGSPPNASSILTRHAIHFVNDLAALEALHDDLFAHPDVMNFLTRCLDAADLAEKTAALETMRLILRIDSATPSTKTLTISQFAVLALCAKTHDELRAPAFLTLRQLVHVHSSLDRMVRAPGLVDTVLSHLASGADLDAQGHAATLLKNLATFPEHMFKFPNFVATVLHAARNGATSRAKGESFAALAILSRATRFRANVYRTPGLLDFVVGVAMARDNSMTSQNALHILANLATENAEIQRDLAQREGLVDAVVWALGNPASDVRMAKEAAQLLYVLAHAPANAQVLVSRPRFMDTLLLACDVRPLRRNEEPQDGDNVRMLALRALTLLVGDSGIAADVLNDARALTKLVRGLRDSEKGCCTCGFDTFDVCGAHLDFFLELASSKAIWKLVRRVGLVQVLEDVLSSASCEVPRRAATVLLAENCELDLHALQKSFGVPPIGVGEAAIMYLSASQTGARSMWLPRNATRFSLRLMRAASLGSSVLAHLRCLLPRSLALALAKGDASHVLLAVMALRELVEQDVEDDPPLASPSLLACVIVTARASYTPFTTDDDSLWRDAEDRARALLVRLGLGGSHGHDHDVDVDDDDLD